MDRLAVERVKIAIAFIHDPLQGLGAIEPLPQGFAGGSFADADDEIGGELFCQVGVAENPVVGGDEVGGEGGVVAEGGEGFGEDGDLQGLGEVGDRLAVGLGVGGVGDSGDEEGFGRERWEGCRAAP